MTVSALILGALAWAMPMGQIAFFLAGLAR